MYCPAFGKLSDFILKVSSFQAAVLLIPLFIFLTSRTGAGLLLRALILYLPFPVLPQDF